MNPIGKHLTPDMALRLFDREGPIIREMFAAWLQSGGKSRKVSEAMVGEVLQVMRAMIADGKVSCVSIGGRLALSSIDVLAAFEQSKAERRAS